jgi:hypothetical protein
MRECRAAGNPSAGAAVSPGTRAGDSGTDTIVRGAPAAAEPRVAVRHGRWDVVALAAVTLAPLVVAGVRLGLARHRPWYPLGDLAIIELVTRDVGHHPVLLGPYSRFGWHHPGPAMFFMLTPPYRLLGGTAFALLASAVAVNLAAATGIVVAVARGAGARSLRWALPVLGLLFAALGASRLQDPWNPSLGILGVAFFVLAAWRVACGGRWWLPVVAAVGSALVQTHVGFLLTVAAVLVVAVAMAVRTSGWAPLRRPAVAGLGAGAVLWAAPLWEQATRSPGNATLLARYVSGAEPSWTAADGLRVAVTRFGALPAHLVGASSVPDPHALDGASPWWGVLTLAGLAAATVAARRRGAGGPLRLAVLTWVVLGTAATTAARVQGPLHDWIIEWMAVGSFLAWLVIGWVVLDRVRIPRIALAVATVALAVGGVRAAVAAPAPRAATSDTAAVLFSRVAYRLPEGPVLVTFGPSRRHGVSSVGWGAGLVLDLERHGRSVWVDPQWHNQFGERLTRPAPAGALVLTVTTDGLHRPAGARPVASVGGVRVFVAG